MSAEKALAIASAIISRKANGEPVDPTPEEAALLREYTIQTRGWNINMMLNSQHFFDIGFHAEVVAWTTTYGWRSAEIPKEQLEVKIRAWVKLGREDKSRVYAIIRADGTWENTDRP